MAQITEARQLKDFDILGVGAVRRALLLSDSGPRVLWTHRSLVPPPQTEFYEAVLRETLEWLKPQEVCEAAMLSSESFQEILWQDFQRHFPQTSNYLKGSSADCLQAYLQEFPWKGPLLTDHFRYFPTYLRRRTKGSRLYLIAQKEWLQACLQYADFGQPVTEVGQVVANPSLQVLYSVEEVFEVGLTPGLTVFYYDAFSGRVLDHKLDVWEAAVLDLLQEERKFCRSQLLEQLLLSESALSSEAWGKKLHLLKSKGIILETGSERIPDLNK